MPPAVLPFLWLALGLIIAFAPFFVGFGLQIAAKRPLPGWLAPVFGTGFVVVCQVWNGFPPTRIYGDALPWLSAIVSAAVMTILFRWGAGLCRFAFLKRFHADEPDHTTRPVK